MNMDLLNELDRAIQAQEVSLVRSLIEKGVDVNTPFRDGTLPLARAVITENLTLLDLLLQGGADVNGLSSPNKETALWRAAARGSVVSVKFLIQAGADVNKVNIMRLTPLCVAASRESDDHVFVVSALIDAKADVNSGEGSTPLMCACRGLAQTVRILLSAGAEVNAMRASGTALHIAIEENQPEIVSVLLEKGADPTLRTPPTAQNPNLTALELAKKLKLRKIVGLLEKTCNITSATKSVVQVLSSRDVWDSLKSRLKETNPRLYRSFRQGAKVEAIKKLEKLIGEPLPKSFTDFYSANDGQRNSKMRLVPPEDFLEDGYYVLPIQEIIQDWKMLRKLVEQGEFEGRRVTSDHEILTDWWNPKWVPFAADGHGDYLCLDLAPTLVGSKGQIISVNHESGRRKLVGLSFDSWLAELLEKLNDNNAG